MSAEIHVFREHRFSGFLSETRVGPSQNHRNHFKVQMLGSPDSLHGFWWFLLHFVALYSYFHCLVFFLTNLMWIFEDLMWIFEIFWESWISNECFSGFPELVMLIHVVDITKKVLMFCWFSVGGSAAWTNMDALEELSCRNQSLLTQILAKESWLRLWNFTDPHQIFENPHQICVEKDQKVKVWIQSFKMHQKSSKSIHGARRSKHLKSGVVGP